MKKQFTITTVLLICFAAASAQTVTIGTLIYSQPYPLQYSVDYARSAMIYTATEMGTTTTGKQLSSVAFYCNTAWNSAPTKVRLKLVGTTTTETYLTWATKITGATLLYSGTPPVTQGWRTLTLSTPFPVTAGQNLEVLVEANCGTSGCGTGSDNSCFYTTKTSAASFVTGTGSPPTGNLSPSSNRPDIRLVFSANIIGVTLGANQNVCSGNSITLTPTVTDGVPPYTYNWSGNQLSCYNCQNPSATISQTSTYTVTVTDANSQTATASQTITMLSPPTANINPASPSICLGLSATLTASGGGSYSWSTGSTSTSITVSPTQSTTYTVTVTASNTCTAAASRLVNVNLPPVVVISPTTSTICLGLSATLTATGGGTYFWSTGSTSSTINVSPTQATTYTITVTGSNTCTAIASRLVNVNLPPTAAISPTSSTICLGQSATLTASGGSSYLWNTGATSATVTVSPTLATTYTVTVTDANTCTAAKSRIVNIYTTPSSSIKADGVTMTSDTITCGDVVQLQLVGSLSGTPNIQWSPNISINNTSISNPIVYPSSTTTYTVTFTNTNGCQQTASILVYVKPFTNIGNVGITTSLGTISLFDTLVVNVQITNVNGLYSLYAKLRGDSAVNAYLNYAGYTVGTLLGSGGSIISTPPVVTGNVYDFGITKIGAVPGYSGSGVFYTFKFVTKNVTIPNNTNFCFYLDNISAYNTSGTPVGLTNQGPYCYTFTNQLNVWPGDLNNSKTVTTADLLPIGYFYNSTGPTRTNATIQWTAQPATLWGYGQTYPNGSAYKVFADSNGDGIISNADQAAIGFNMGKIHALAMYQDHHERAQGDGTVTVSANPSWINTTQLPQSVALQVSLQNNGGLNALYGISVNLLLDNTVFDLTTANVDYAGSIFGTNGTDCLVIHQITDSSVSVGLTRYASSPINGQGLLCTVTLQTKSSVSVNQTQIISFIDAANNQAGDPLTVDGGNLGMNVGSTNVGIENITSDYFSIYPNPAANVFTIKNTLTAVELKDVHLEIFNSLGQKVFQSKITQTMELIPTGSWGVGGLYSVIIKNGTTKTISIKKLVLEP